MAGAWMHIMSIFKRHILAKNPRWRRLLVKLEDRWRRKFKCKINVVILNKVLTLEQNKIY